MVISEFFAIAQISRDTFYFEKVRIIALDTTHYMDTKQYPNSHESAVFIMFNEEN